MHCLLLGNGLNRLALKPSWSGLLARLIAELKLANQIDSPASKPLPVLFEELCARRARARIEPVESRVKNKISKLLCNLQPDPLLESFCDPFTTILTTNYDDAIERIFPLVPTFRASQIKEGTHSLFRKVDWGVKQVWHIHGDVGRPQSLTLGLTQYLDYVHAIKSYMGEGHCVFTQGRRTERISSPFLHGWRHFEPRHGIIRAYSWIDHFLRDDIHIVGLSVDYSELDLWWLLSNKRRLHRKYKAGHTYFYHVALDAPDPPQISTLESLGVRIVRVPASSYRDGYQKVLQQLLANIDERPADRSWELDVCALQRRISKEGMAAAMIDVTPTDADKC